MNYRFCLFVTSFVARGVLVHRQGFMAMTGGRQRRQGSDVAPPRQNRRELDGWHLSFFLNAFIGMIINDGIMERNL